MGNGCKSVCYERGKIMECLNYGTEKCVNCSNGQKAYCDRVHDKIKNGTYDLAQDYWDYIELVVEDDEDF